MAETWTRHLKGDLFDAYSAGVQPKGVDPRTVKAMADVGIDISMQISKDTDSLEDMEFDYVVTLCDNARESCPYFPAKIRLVHRGFDDPPKLAEGVNDEDKAMNHYRRVRDEIKAFVMGLPELLEGTPSKN
jgi:arsenate reductase